MTWSKWILSATVLAALSLTGCLNSETSTNSKVVKGTSSRMTRAERKEKIAKNRVEHERRQRENKDRENSKDGNVKAASLGEVVKDACYVDLCENNKEDISLPDLRKKASHASKEQKEHYAQHLAGLVKEVMELENKSNQLGLDLLVKKESEFPTLQLTTEQLNFMKVLRIAQVDREGLVQLFSQIKDLDFIKAYNLSEIKGPEGYFEALFGSPDVKEGLKKELAYTEGLISLFKKKLQMSSLTALSSYAERIRAGQILTPEEQKAVLGESLGIRLAHHVVFVQPELVSRTVFNEALMNDIYKKSNIKDVIKNEIAGINDRLGICESNYYSAINLMPSQKQKEQFLQMSEEVRKAVLSQLAPNDAAYSAVKETVVQTAMLREDVAKIFGQYLKNKKMDLEASIKASQSADAKEIFMMVISKIFSGGSKNLCDDIIDLKVSDAAYLQTSRITASWLTVTKPEYGVGILAHEFAHVVSEHSKNFASAKQCLADKKSGRKATLEEDFADAFAFQVTLSLEQSLRDPRDNTKVLSQKNYACALASDSALRTLNIDLEHSHSSSAYRALQFALAKGQEIPQSCKDLTKEQPRALEVCK